MIFKTKYLTLAISLLTISLTMKAQQGEVNVSQNSDIDKLLEYKKDIKTNKIYKIQVFDSTDPDKAQREKDNFLNAYDEWPVEIVWSTPNYKVWVGNFATKLETDRALQKIKKDYIYAFPFQPKLDKK
jgi:fatty acid-binding protein DegV